MSKSPFLFAIVFFVLVLGWERPIYADLYASIRGKVSDPSGAVINGADVSAANIATGSHYSGVETTDGYFTFPQLPIGDYTITVEKAGFKRYETKIHLNVNQTYLLDVTMEVGAVAQKIVVESNPIQVESSSMQLGTTVTGRQIVDIPLNGRNWTQLQQLQSGVQASSDRFGTFSTNGSQTQQNAFLINGVDTNDIRLNVPFIIPSPDAIGEFRMITSTINPEYGRNSGAILNAVIKNGTNQFHGDAFEFYRDTFLDAKSWFQLTASPFHQNQFGGTLGGPIIKDHAFFFFSYQGTRATQPQVVTGNTVFSPAERAGDFSASTIPVNKGSNVSPFAMEDSSGVLQPAGTPYSTLFSTGFIPTADFNPLSVKLLNQYIPLPNAPGNLYEFNPVTSLKDDQFIYRVDERIRERDALWFYGLYEKVANLSTIPSTNLGSATLPGFGVSSPAHSQEYTVAWNHTFSSTSLNELRFAYLRVNLATGEPQNIIDPTTYGFTGITPQNRSIESLPAINLAGLFSFGFGTPQPRVQNTYQVVDNFSKVWGRHTFKAGFSMERWEINNPFYQSNTGSFSFNGAGVFSTGNAGADFLLGIPDRYNQASGSIVRGRAQEYYSYVQDLWQVKANLTLTLGVGWDVETPLRNLYADGEIMAAFIPGEQSKIFPTAPVGVVYPGDPGVNKYGGPTVHYGDFAPRVGFAWNPRGSQNWSIRGGIGLYYNRGAEEATFQTVVNPPFAIDTTGASVFGAPAFANPFTSVNPAPVGGIPAGSVANPFPFTPPMPGARINFVPFEPLGLSMSTEDPRNTAPRSTNYNLTVERQLSKSMVLSVGYVGNVARHLEGAYNLNQAGIAPGVNPVAVAAGCTSDFTLATCAPQTFPFDPSVYGQIGLVTTEFNSNYNSLQISLNKRFSGGLQLTAAYTYSRYFDFTSNLENNAFNAPGINPLDIRSMYGPSANDAPQRFVASYIYTLPFYKLLGDRWRRLTDNWNLVGVTTFQHGFPVAVWNTNFTDLVSGGGYYNNGFYAPLQRVNVTGAPLGIRDPRNYSIGGLPNYWFNPAAFTSPAPGTGVGDANRNPLYGPGINNWDMALEKNVYITEAKSRYFQLRFETFNTFNHAQFAAPENIFGTANFGRILGVQQGSTNGAGRVAQLGAKFYF